MLRATSYPGPAPELTAIPSRPEEVPRFLDNLPQDIVSTLRNGRHLGEVILISCRADNDGYNPVQELSPWEYKILLEAANGQSKKTVAHQVSVSTGRKVNPNTVDTQLGRVYQKLNVHDRLAAATFIPIDDRQLRSFSLTQHNAEGNPEPILSATQMGVYEGFIDDEPREQLAQRLRLSRSGVDMVIHRMPAKLGLENRTQLKRVGFAMRNVEKFVTEMAGPASKILGATAYALAYADQEKAHEEKSLGEWGNIDTTGSSHIFTWLQEMGYVTEGKDEGADVDITAYVAAKLATSYFTRDEVTGEATRYLARDIIREEAARFKAKSRPVIYLRAQAA